MDARRSVSEFAGKAVTDSLQQHNKSVARRDDRV